MRELEVTMTRGEVTTSVIPGLVDDNRPRYTVTTPFVAGVELAADAGPDELDVIYERTTLSAPSPMTHQDELLSSVNTLTEGVAIALAPVISAAQIEALTVGTGATKNIFLQPVL